MQISICHAYVFMLQDYFLDMCELLQLNKTRLSLFYCNIYFILLHMKPPLNNP